MTVSPHSGIIDFGTFTSPDPPNDGIQGEVPAPLSAQNGYVLSTSGWIPNPTTAPGGSNTQIQFNSAGAFAGASGLTTDGTNLTITGATNPTAPTLSLTAGSNITGTTLSGVQITGTAGQFSCNAASLSVGQLLTISGTLGGTGTITGYANPTTYRISATNGSTTFTLVNNSTGAALTTTTGTPTGLTYTVTSPGVDIAQTWNNTSVTFTGLRFNATDTASAAGSLLMDLQVGGSSRFQFFKNGGGVVIATSGTGTGQFGVRLSGDAASRAVIGLDTADNGVVGFGSGSVSRDTFFGRRGPANLRLGAADAAAPVAQTLSVQSVVAGTTNTAGANFTITGSQGTGTGAGGSIIFQVAPAGSSGTAQNALQNTFTIVAPSANQSLNNLSLGWNGNGPMLFGTNVGIGSGINTYNVFFPPAGGVSIGGLDAILTRRAAANLRLGAADAAAPVAQTLSVQSVVAGTSNTAGANLTITGSQGTGTGAGGEFRVDLAPPGTSGTAQNALVNAMRLIRTSDVRTTWLISSNGGDAGWFAEGNTFSFTSSNHNFEVPGASFLRTGAGFGLFIGTGSNRSGLYGGAQEAANTLALRNANNGQTFRIYGRFTDITNDFERFFINAPTTSGAAVQLGTQKGATTGAARALEFQTDGTTRLTIGSAGGLTLADAQDIAVGSTTGTKIGTATTQKIGFYNKAPVVQPTAVADATDNATAITQLNALLSRMRDLGLIAT